MIQVLKYFQLVASTLAACLVISACGGGAAEAPPTNTNNNSLPSGNSPTVSTPTGNSPTNSTPTGNSPTNSTPAGNSPTNTTPAGNSPTAVPVVDPNAINLETGGKGATFTWVAFDNGGAGAPAVVANPSATGINTSTKVLKFSLVPGAAWYTGMESKHGVSGVGSDLGTTAMTTANALVKMKVYKSLISDVGFKLVKEDGASEGDVRVANTKINEWEELSFNFCNKIASVKTIDQIVIFPDFNAFSVDHTNTSTSYVDDITFNACPIVVVPTAPTTAPAVPTAPPGNVIALFSDAYAAVTGTDYPSFGSSTVLTAEVIATNNVLKFSNFSYNGITFPAQNLSTFTNLHIDVWSATATTIELKLVSLNPTQEQAVFKAVSAGVWTSIVVPLSEYSVPNKTKIEQMVVAINPAGGTVYVDNLYFSK